MTKSISLHYLGLGKDSINLTGTLNRLLIKNQLDITWIPFKQCCTEWTKCLKSICSIWNSYTRPKSIKINKF